MKLVVRVGTYWIDFQEILYVFLGNDSAGRYLRFNFQTAPSVKIYTKEICGTDSIDELRAIGIEFTGDSDAA